MLRIYRSILKERQRRKLLVYISRFYYKYQTFYVWHCGLQLWYIIGDINFDS